MYHALQCHKNHEESHALQANSCDNLNKGTANWLKWRGTAVAERGSIHTIHTHTVHCARDLEFTVAQGFVKHGFKVLLHPVVDIPLQASRYLVSRTL